MRDIQWLLDNVERYKNATVQKRLKSKKNTVAYVVLKGQPRVLKWFVPGLKQNMETEYTILKRGCSHLSIPSPFEKDTENNVLILSYFQGENVCDLLNNVQTPGVMKEQVVDVLADWFVLFHTFFKTDERFRIRGDATLRNFIYQKGHIWGVDFEESRNGKPGEDLGTLCASLLSTDPMFTQEKVTLCRRFLDHYRSTAKWTIENINTEISYALLERIQWRAADEALLRKYATNIRTKGLQAAQLIS